uniref:Uncharacterized protein n=1 Tax=Clytia hemisphaerica TaxID=252671 RepID=A0A7M6DQT6_9CNID
MSTKVHQLHFLNRSIAPYPIVPGLKTFIGSSKVECNIILPCESPVEVIIEAKSFNVIATAVSSGITINGSNIPSSSSQFLASGDVIIIGGKITLKFEFNDIVFKRVDGNNIIVSDNLPNFIKQNDNGLFATSLPMDGLLPDDIVDKMDDTIHEIQSETMINVVTTMKPLLEDVIVGKLANWRHETFHRRIPDVHPNTLVSMGRHGLNNADFKEETIDQLVDQLRALYPLSPYTYVYGVLMPTILKWMVMSTFQVFSDEAEFYLQSGGKNNQKIAMESFSRQMKTRRESQFQAGAIPSQILVGDVNSSQVGTSQTSATGTDVILQNVVGIDVNNSLDSTKNASTSTDPSQNVRAQQDVAVPNTTKKRQKRPCPVCKAPLTGLPRHMRDVHEWSWKKSAKVNSLFKSRQPYTKKDGQSTSEQSAKRKGKRCPMEGCFFVGIQVGRHLRKEHCMKFDDENYKDALKAARVHEPLTSENIQKNRRAVAREFELAENIQEYEKEVESGTGRRSEEKVIDYAMIMFERYLISVEGNFRDKRSAKQCVQEVKTVALHLGSLVALFDKKKVRDGFFQSYLDPKSKPSTSKHYLTSLISFMGFVITEGLESLADIVNQDDVVAMKLRLGNWRKAYGKKQDVLRWERDDEINEVLVTLDQIKTFEESEQAINAITILEQETDLLPSRNEFLTVRDYLFARIALANAHRTGVCANMTMKEYENVLTKDDHKVIKVRKHKTFDKHGYAHVEISNELFQLLKLYVDKVRPTFSRPDSENVFISCTGRSMESSAISQIINRTLGGAH